MIKQTDTESLINSRLFLTLWDIHGYICPRELMTLETNDKPPASLFHVISKTQSTCLLKIHLSEQFNM